MAVGVHKIPDKRPTFRRDILFIVTPRMMLVGNEHYVSDYGIYFKANIVIKINSKKCYEYLLRICLKRGWIVLEINSISQSTQYTVLN